jgi:hypothetical protein
VWWFAIPLVVMIISALVFIFFARYVEQESVQIQLCLGLVGVVGLASIYFLRQWAKSHWNKTNFVGVKN